MAMEQKNKFLNYYEKYMFVVGICGHFIFVLQFLKIISNKSASDVSLEGFLVAFFSLLSWFVYGVLKKDYVLIIVNLFGVLVAGMCLLAIVLYK